MTDPAHTIISIAERPELEPRLDPIMFRSWADFMLNDPVGNRLWNKLFSVFPDYQFVLLDRDDTILAIGNSLPFHFGKELDELPDTGWDWVMEKGFADKRAGLEPTLVSALAITIPEEHRAKRLSAVMVRHMVELTRRAGLSALVAPVRPNFKAKYPTVPIAKYVAWKDKEGLPFDPWLRVHVRLGGEIIKVCHHAMTIPGRVDQWERWAGMAFPESGSYVVPGALVPVHVDIEHDLAEYVEPNVWVVHRV